MKESNPIGHVVNPYVVGGAVIALKCKEGIIIGTDTLLSYGSLLSTIIIIKNIPTSVGSRKSHKMLLLQLVVSMQTSNRLLED